MLLRLNSKVKATICKNIPVNKVLLRPNLLAKYPPVIFVITPQNS